MQNVTRPMVKIVLLV